MVGPGDGAVNPVVIVGLGGIGSHLAEPLCRFLSTLSSPPQVVLVDGDTYASDNRGRQRVGREEIGVNKAVAQARRLADLLP